MSRKRWAASPERPCQPLISARTLARRSRRADSACACAASAAMADLSPACAACVRSASNATCSRWAAPSGKAARAASAAARSPRAFRLRSQPFDPLGQIFAALGIALQRVLGLIAIAERLALGSFRSAQRACALGNARFKLRQLPLCLCQPGFGGLQLRRQRRTRQFQLAEPGATFKPFCRRRTVTARYKPVPAPHPAIARDQTNAARQRSSAIGFGDQNQSQARSECIGSADMIGQPQAAVGQGRAIGGYIRPGPEAPIAGGGSMGALRSSPKAAARAFSKPLSA